jgi:dTDP-4-dehydrorhamnose 3,5-epimerase
MRFTQTNIDGVYIIDLEPRADARGFFARAFCEKELEEHGLNPRVAQMNLSFSYKAGTLRGLHYQVPPVAETKLMRCIRGVVYDVVVDMRPESSTYLKHVGVELSADNRRMLYVPALFAHGYLTLTDNAEVLYPVGEFYTPGYEQGVRYDDPLLNIDWPYPVSVVSEKDLSWKLLKSNSVS